MDEGPTGAATIHSFGESASGSGVGVQSPPVFGRGVAQQRTRVVVKPIDREFVDRGSVGQLSVLPFAFVLVVVLVLDFPSVFEGGRRGRFTN
jgi:hypothetical protein